MIVGKALVLDLAEFPDYPMPSKTMCCINVLFVKGGDVVGLVYAQLFFTWQLSLAACTTSLGMLCGYLCDVTLSPCHSGITA